MTTEEMNERYKRSYIKFDIRNQGKFVVGLLVIIYTYYGFICNILMYNEYGNQIQKSEWSEGFLIIWAHEAYLETYFLPAIILFIVCFLITVGEDIPYYGIKNSFWYMPIIISSSVIWHWVVFGITAQPLLLLFGDYRGYLHILIITCINLSGSYLGFKIKRFIENRRRAIQNRTRYRMVDKDFFMMNFPISLLLSWGLIDVLVIIFKVVDQTIIEWIIANTLIIFVLSYVIIFILLFVIFKLIGRLTSNSGLKKYLS